MSAPQLIGGSALRRLASHTELRELMRATLAARQDEDDTGPQRFAFGPANGPQVGVMPGAGRLGLGLKAVALAPGLGHEGLYLRFNPNSGALTHLIEASTLTALRTAAASAAATEALHAPQSLRSVLILGSGAQAVEHARAFRELAPQARIRMVGRNAQSLRRLRNLLTPAEMLHLTLLRREELPFLEADVLITCTSSPEALFRAGEVRILRHVVAVGSCQPTQRELPGALVAACDRFVDSLPQARREAGDLLLARDEGFIGTNSLASEIGPLLRAATRTMRTRPTLFKSLGLAIEDTALAEFAVARLEAREAHRSIATDIA
jgi:ornithine cyclodeaminase/alanine dehydrogenase-like protein (mu-crystallin family)